MNHRFNAKLHKLPWCPECDAKPSEPCSTVGHKNSVREPHVVRELIVSGELFVIKREVAAKRGLLRILTRLSAVAVAVVALAACAVEPTTVDAAIDVHEIGECDASWIGRADLCERACAARPSGEPTGARCLAKLDTGESVSCDAGFWTLLGVDGCCVSAHPNHRGTAKLAECSP